MTFLRDIVRDYLKGNPLWRDGDIDTVTFYGMDGIFDSLDLVRFIIYLEEEITKHTYQKVSLRTDKAFSHRRNPFVSLASLEEFVKECINEDSDNRN